MADPSAPVAYNVFMDSRTRLFLWPACLCLLVVAVYWRGQDRAGPEAISDLQFERLSLQLSEPPGYFDTDNLISNESSYQHVIPALRVLTQPGGAYLGVGPDQNYTYIAHVRPGIAFIVDIRRDNVLLHLFFKQLLENSLTRQEFLARLLGRPLSGDSTAGDADVFDLTGYFRKTPGKRAYFEEVFQETWRGVRRRFPGLVTEADYPTLSAMAEAFFQEGLDLRFRSHWRSPRAIYPSLYELLTATDLMGTPRSYLASEDDFEYVRSLHLQNRIVPITGDLSGEKALPSLAEYLRGHSIVVSTLYASNVEFYLLRDGTFSNFVRNLRLLPLDSHGVIIRSYFDYWRQPHPEQLPGHYVTSLLQGLEEFVESHSRQPYRDYRDVAFRDYYSNRNYQSVGTP